MLVNGGADINSKDPGSGVSTEFELGSFKGKQEKAHVFTVFFLILFTLKYTLVLNCSIFASHRSAKRSTLWTLMHLLVQSIA